MMFILIFEDGSIGKSKEIDDETFEACDNGFVDIINVGINPPLIYQKGNWIKIQNV